MSVYSVQDFSVPLPLSIHAEAQLFCQPQWTRQKIKQVYLNTLAVYTVHSYLRCLGIESSLAKGHSWDPAMQCLTDAADLVVGAQGRLECRPVTEADAVCHVPPEVWGDRVGYVAVQLGKDLRYARLLGFLPSVDKEDIPLSQWRSPTTLLSHIAPEPAPEPAVLPGAESAVTPVAVSGRFIPEAEEWAGSISSHAPVLTSVSDWLQGKRQQGWHSLESLGSPHFAPGSVQPALNFRNATAMSTVRGKYLDWTLPTGQQENLVLVVGVMPVQKSEMDIWVKLCPQEASTYLPPKLEVVVLDAQNKAVMQAQSRQTEMIQLKFGGHVGEMFSIKVSLNESSKIESFVI